MPETLIVVHTQGQTYYFEPGQQPSESVYGGPLQPRLHGDFGPAPLHHIATLSTEHLPMLGGISLPLLYGFQYSGCTLDYQYSPLEVNLLDMDPQESTPEWPYADYPPLLPRLALRLASVQAERWEDFSSRARYPNLPARQSAELVAVIPAPLHIGQSLWGEDGDDEGVCVVCECDLTRHQVHSYNICS